MTSTPKYRIGSQVIFGSTKPGIRYELGIVKGAEINGAGWVYSVISDNITNKTEEGKIMAEVFEKRDCLTQEEMAQKEQGIQLP